MRVGCRRQEIAVAARPLLPCPRHPDHRPTTAHARYTSGMGFFVAPLGAKITCAVWALPSALTQKYVLIVVKAR